MSSYCARRVSGQRSIAHALSLVLLATFVFGLNGCDSKQQTNANLSVANTNGADSSNPEEDFRVVDLPVGGHPYLVTSGHKYRITAFNEENGPYKIVVYRPTSPVTTLLEHETTTAQKLKFASGQNNSGAAMEIKIDVPVKPAGAQLRYVAIPFSADGSTKAGALVVIFDVNAPLAAPGRSSTNVNTNAAANNNANSNEGSLELIPFGTFTTPVGVVVIRTQT